jgi:hypothetical protein
VSESVAAALEGRVRLLVIDNCEHVLDAAADQIEAILTHSATVRILATSREGLGVPTSRCGRCPRWTSAREWTLPQSICSSNAPGVWPWSAHRLDQVSRLLAPEDGVGSVVELASRSWTWGLGWRGS